MLKVVPAKVDVAVERGVWRGTCGKSEDEVSAKSDCEEEDNGAIRESDPEELVCTENTTGDEDVERDTDVRVGEIDGGIDWEIV